jgi:predicted DsbA family dithiol-disulfide isomerase
LIFMGRAATVTYRCGQRSGDGVGVEIQVWSDVVCPWCYIGKRRLEKALSQFPDAVTVTYRAYQLDPSPLPASVPLKPAMSAKFGGPARAEQMFTHVTEVAAADGLTLDFDRAVLANTFDSHRLIAWAADQGRQADMLDTVQHAHFSEGIDIGSHAELAVLAERIGLDRAAAVSHLESEAGADAVRRDLSEASELGVTSVPTFVIDDKYAIQGAQEPSVLLSALEEVARRQAVDAGR